jgi:hypothetical protein
MESQQLLRLIRSFADRPDDVVWHKSQLAFSLHDNTIAVTVENTPDGLCINDGSARLPVRRWIVDSLAQLPLLARRIKEHLPDNPLFIEPAAHLEHNYSFDGTSLTGVLPAAVNAARAWCDSQAMFSSRVLYITSDAGEGKTTTINELARRQADRFLTRQSTWLMLPVSLGGRPFLQLDEVIIAALSQTFRFQRLYFEGFVELVRLGVVVLALDGFEELFVQGQASDAVSSLGNLLSLLKSEGTVVIAARKAYFDYKSIDTQAKLFDSLSSVEVEFARLHLNKWDKGRFLQYAAKSGVDDPDRLYSFWLSRTHDEAHPLLCRPVLIKHVVKMGESTAGEAFNALAGLSTTVQYYEPFVRQIIAREANEKWIDRSGTPVGPLISVDEHFQLLSTVAREMWMMEQEVVNAEILEFAAEEFCESKKLSPGVTRQVVERVKQHALIASTADRRRFHFDHEEFFQFFLGLAISDDCVSLREGAAARLLGDRPLPFMVLEAAAGRIRAKGDPKMTVELLSQLCEREQGFSALRENCGNLAVLCSEGNAEGRLSVRRMAVTQDVLAGRSFCNVDFHECHFGNIELRHSRLSSCSFTKCTFMQIVLCPDSIIEQSIMSDCEVENVVIDTGEEVGGNSIYSPAEIQTTLRRRGFAVQVVSGAHAPDDESQATVPVDTRLRLFQRFLRVFSRATGVNDGVIKQRLGTESHVFFDQVLPILKENGVVAPVEYRGGGSQERIKLGVPMRIIQAALEQSDGSFDEFLAAIGQMKGTGR